MVYIYEMVLFHVYPFGPIIHQIMELSLLSPLCLVESNSVYIANGSGDYAWLWDLSSSKQGLIKESFVMSTHESVISYLHSTDNTEQIWEGRFNIWQRFNVCVKWMPSHVISFLSTWYILVALWLNLTQSVPSPWWSWLCSQRCRTSRWGQGEGDTPLPPDTAPFYTTTSDAQWMLEENTPHGGEGHIKWKWH